MEEKTFTTTTLIGNHVCMTEEDHDQLINAVNVKIAAVKENALLVNANFIQEKDIKTQQATIDKLVEALRPFAQFACSPEGECECNNCKARELIKEK